MRSSSAHLRHALRSLALALAVSAAAAFPLLAQAGSSTGNDYTKAGVTFMQGMIMHHAQAVVMSDWAVSHGASPQVATLCKRIALSQRDEIALMQNWLKARQQSAPDPLHMLSGATRPITDSSPLHMPGMDMGQMPMLMDGMLTAAQMQQLDAARGLAFDTLYLAGMIHHHQGALTMVKDLFATPGAGQQSELFGFATDIDAGQRAEIHRMQLILNSLTKNPSR